MDFVGDARKSLSSSNTSCLFIDLPGRCDTGVLLRALIGVVNLGKVCEDSVRGSGDDSELPSIHPLTFGDSATIIVGIIRPFDLVWCALLRSFAGDVASSIARSQDISQ